MPIQSSIAFCWWVYLLPNSDLQNSRWSGRRDSGSLRGAQAWFCRSTNRNPGVCGFQGVVSCIQLTNQERNSSHCSALTSILGQMWVPSIVKMTETTWWYPGCFLSTGFYVQADKACRVRVIRTQVSGGQNPAACAERADCKGIAAHQSATVTVSSNNESSGLSRL